jgi:hypothetical protein
VAALLSAGSMLALTAAALTVMVAARQTSFANLWGTVVLALACAAVGFAVARRQPANPIGWLLLAFAVIDLVGGFTSAYALLCYRLGHGGLPLGRAAVVAEALSGSLTSVILPLVVLLFPDGRLPSRRWRWAMGTAVVSGAVLVAGQFAQAMSAVIGHPVQVDSSGGLVALNNPPRGPWEMAANGLAIAVYLLVWLLAAGRQVVAWRKADGVRRQQLKWLMSGACLAGIGLAGIITADSLPGVANSATGNTFDGVIGTLIVALPISTGVAILKYRLYDIDRIISRTLAYAIVTGLLVGLYAGLVLLATRVLSLHGTVAVAAATLVAAALFNPLRRRVQRRVDRRFNRARYNADQTVAAFAARLKDAVDLDSVRDDIAGVVNQALEPAHISVWISPRG